MGTLVAGAGVFIFNECVDLCSQLIASKAESGPPPRIPAWEQVSPPAANLAKHDDMVRIRELPTSSISGKRSPGRR